MNLTPSDQLKNNDLNLFATAPKGIENILTDELQVLGARNVKPTRAGASFTGNIELAYRACLWLRTANRVLLPIEEFHAETPEELYQRVQTISWHEHLDSAGTFAVDFQSSQSKITHTQYGALKTKDAIVDQFRDHFNHRPSIDLEKPDIRINVYVLRNMATVSLDLSGQSLHKRGYRLESGRAPLKENLAAAILLRSNWPQIAKQGGGLIDPMCGSGTLPIEAALMAGDHAPGLLRDYFGFLKWKQHQPDIWEKVLIEAEKRKTIGMAKLPAIVGYDGDNTAIRYSLANMEKAGLRAYLHFEKKDLTDCVPHPKMKYQPGLVVVNPPYGERIGVVRELEPLYRNLGHCLKMNFQGWKSSLFTGNDELGKRMGIRANKVNVLYNGAIKCKLLSFDITPEWFVEKKYQDTPPSIKPYWKPQPEAQMFANRLKKNLRKLKNWRKKEGITCYRAYDNDLPEYAVAVDVYENHVHVQEYKAPETVDPEKAKARLNDIIAILPDALNVPAENIFLKIRQKQKGPSQYKKQKSENIFHDVTENSMTFLVNFTDYLDTGLFLDHRMTRNLIGKMSKGKDFLNLFAYTGAATVYAAKGGAKSTTTVDMSKIYLEWAKRNMAANGFSYNRHYFHCSECLEWVQKENRKYDLIFVDPPTFSNSKKLSHTFDVQRDHVMLIHQLEKILTPKGTIIFSNNFRRFKMDFDSLKNFSIQELSKSTLPPDFIKRPKIHNCWDISRHLK